MLCLRTVDICRTSTTNGTNQRKRHFNCRSWFRTVISYDFVLIPDRMQPVTSEAFENLPLFARKGVERIYIMKLESLSQEVHR